MHVLLISWELNYDHTEVVLIQIRMIFH